MNINILTVGSRGDVQPYLALGVGLQQAGYRVRLTTHDTFQPLISRYGLDFFPIGGDIQAVTRGETGQAMIEAGRNPLRVLQHLRQALEPLMAECLENSWRSCQDADVIISSGTAFWGDDIAVRMELPSFIGLLQPISETREFPHPLAPRVNLGGIFNRLTYQLLNRFYWQLFKPTVSQWRQKELALPPHAGCPFLNDRWQSLPKLYGYSPMIVPTPTDWTNSCHVTGYWFLETADNFTPPSDLLAFLEAGEPPVSIGFGSMASRDAEDITAIALSALEKTGQRGLLLTGWGGISNTDLPDHVFKLESIPHDWLFPKMKAIVHHGGAGTTAATVRSGVPGIVVPFFADQPFWGDRVANLGISPAPIPKNQLSADQLANAIQQAVHDESMQLRARRMGETIRAEEGVATAVQIVQTTLAKQGGNAAAVTGQPS